MNCDVQISIDNQRIVRVKETNFLGVILDENLNLSLKYHMLQTMLRSRSVYLSDIVFKCSFYLP